MKKHIILSIVLVFTLLTVKAQNNTHYPPQPIIEVTGSAELEIIPDEINVSVTIREYMVDRKKTNITDIEKEFRSVLDKLKIEPKSISLESVYGNYDYDYKTNKRGEFLNAKVYRIKFTDLEKYNQLVTMLDKKGIENVYISSTSHSKIEEYRRQVKVEALKAAKAKADLMLQALNKKTGEVMLIRERDNNMGYPMPYMKAQSNMVMESDAEKTPAEPIEMQKIKIRYEVEAHFLIVP